LCFLEHYFGITPVNNAGFQFLLYALVY